MQRRRSTLTNNSTTTSNNNHRNHHSRQSSAFRNNGTTTHRRQSSAYRDPHHPYQPVGIELRDRPSHGTSSSISQTFHPRPQESSDGSSYALPSYLPSRAPDDTIIIMKPVVSAMQAWSCVVISAFAIVILSILGLLFRSNHHEMVGGINDPENGPEVAATIFIAVIIYAGFLVFCGLQGLLHLRENRRGAIALQ